MLRIKELFTKILTAISGKVDKSGDTMTGVLHLDSANIDFDNLPSAETRGSSYVRFLDSDDNEIARFGPSVFTDGRIGMYLQARRPVNNDTVANQLVLLVSDDGTRTVSVNAPDAWRTALNVVNKAGDTMTGTLSINSDSTTAPAFVNRVKFARGATHSTASATASYIINDKNGVGIGRMDAYFTADGYEGIRVGTSRVPAGASSAVGNYLHLLINSSGNKRVMFSDLAPWKSALGITNYNNTWISTSTIADIITVNTTNATIDIAYYAQYGHAAMLYIQWKNKAAITITTAGGITDTVVGTIVSGKRPRAICNAFGRESNGLTYSILASGVVTLTSGNGGAAAKTIAANTVNNLYVFYMV